ncbi:MAG: urf-2 [Gallionellaceae bacterium]|nr:MAG: urf-2 [Gallionellaceae bacterium]
MATPIQPEVQPEKISCSLCRKEVPLSAALTPQGADYVGYFCGIECYDEFSAQKESQAPEKPQK